MLNAVIMFLFIVCVNACVFACVSERDGEKVFNQSSFCLIECCILMHMLQDVAVML